MVQICMLSDEWLDRIYSLRETLTKNFEVNSTNVTESNERTNIRTDKHQGENYISKCGLKLMLLKSDQPDC